ncbi:hypothetical protein GCM10008992_32120 [Halorubrum aquaticum]
MNVIYEWSYAPVSNGSSEGPSRTLGIESLLERCYVEASIPESKILFKSEMIDRLETPLVSACVESRMIGELVVNKC